MASIKIKHTKTLQNNSEETVVMVDNLDYGADSLTQAILEALGTGKKQPEQEATDGGEKQDSSPTDAVMLESDYEIENPLPYNIRSISFRRITPERLKAAMKNGELNTILHPYDEIDIPTDTGKPVTVVCGDATENWARFIFKDCWDEGEMNETDTNKGGYYKSKGRAHVLTKIWPHIAKEWREIVKPRKLVEEIDGERIEYADPMWLPSATDVFGPSENGYWKDLDDSFQLPIFKRERERVKEYGENGTYLWWLRSVYATSTSNFRLVATGGSSGNGNAGSSYGFAPGFDIGNQDNPRSESSGKEEKGHTQG